MRKLWSISTTVRNPARLRNFLYVLKELENQNFDQKTQIEYQIRLIQHKFYKPSKIPHEFREHYKYLNPMPYEIAKTIFNEQGYVDPAMRGRQSANPLNKLGLSIARESLGSVKITTLGNEYLSGDYDVSLIFFKSLLKLQFPNPWSSDFSAERGFNISPLIATFHLLNKLNMKSSRKGLSKSEFCIFIPTLININQIDEYVEKILDYRKEKEKEKEKYIHNFAREFYQTDSVSVTMINNFFEYGDNTMRYFRLTRYFRVETDPLGYYYSIDLESSRMEEIQQLLDGYDGGVIKDYTSISDYMSFISDIKQPELPWEKIDNIRKVATSVKDILKNLIKKENLTITQEEEEYIQIDIFKLYVEELKEYISTLRTYNLERKEEIHKHKLVRNKNKLKEIISILKDQKSLRKIKPEQFEKIITEAFKVINDEIVIKPNYPVDDEGEPIIHAPGNKPDIECYYEVFNAICEVTLNTSKMQWVLEGQPVMRHLRKFEIENKDSCENIFCVFLAPRVHDDTYSTFWISVKYEFDGKPQKIIPLTLEQFILILEAFLYLLNQNKKYTHKELLDLWIQIVEKTKEINSFSEWISAIQDNLIEWKSQVIST